MVRSLQSDLIIEDLDDIHLFGLFVSSKVDYLTVFRIFLYMICFQRDIVLKE
jgi:hypothetical protein